MRGAEHVTRFRITEMHTGFRCGNVRERHHFEDLVVHGRIILKWLFRK
jgi:hypothetical protein